MKNKHTLFSFVDILLILFLFIVCAVFAAHNFNNNERFYFTPEYNISVTLRVKEMPKKYEDIIVIKDNLYLENKNESIGKIKYISFTNSSVEFLDKLTNTSAIYKSPDKIDMLISVDCNAVFADEKYYIDDIIFEAGETISISIPKYSFDATIIKIEKNEV